MFGSAILEVAIGLVFVYLTMSLICSAINEMIETKLKNRATDLERGIRELFMEKDVKGSDKEDEKGMVQKLYEHPLLCGLFKGDFGGKLITKSSYWCSTNLPSYVPNRNFAVALIDIVMSPPSAPPSSTPITVDSLRAVVSDMKDSAIKRALSSFLATAGNDIVKVRESIETWFDSAMERVAGWYKRRTQWILVILGFVMSIALNVNTLTVAQHLWIDPPLRNSIVAKADDRIRAGVGDSKDAGQTLQKSKGDLKTLGLPIGWPEEERILGTYGIDKKAKPSKWVCAILWAFVGWAITAAAVSFGAPFWFDLLSKFLSIRSTVKPQEKNALPDRVFSPASPPFQTTSAASDPMSAGRGFRPNEWTSGDPQEGIL
jgi:hypothetical protein